ncbi:MAG: non-homologous end-joining DNA ligase [Solirubrobacterales bacterium]|nr:non-homologous end-joining DNA ligase [Solirubrobacterales bacterium]
MSGLRLAKKDRVTRLAVGGPQKSELEIDGRLIQLSNLDRILYPETGFTKRDLIDYYAGVAPVLLPHLEGRPLSMHRFPEGVDEEGFWEKQCPAHRPDWVATASIKSRSSSRGKVEYCLVNDLPTLIWVANLACVELHVSLAAARRRKTPDFMVFDLDPGEGSDILDCAEIALLIHDTLKGQQLECEAKVSGSKGIQVYVPLNSRARYERTGNFAHSLARAFEEELPDLVVSNMRRELRKGKVLIDWSQNSEHKTTVAVYSMRAKPEPTVSFPVRRERLERALDRCDPESLRFKPEWVLKNISGGEDPFAPVLHKSQKLPR